MSNSIILYEDDVVSAVSQYLQTMGMTISQQLLSSQKGDDIVAFWKSKNTHIRIEAKGATSALQSSSRFGKPFSKSQVKDHVANAFYRAAKMQESPLGEKTLVGIALPKNTYHLEVVSAIKSSLEKLQIEVFWVDSSLQVSVVGHWKLNPTLV